MDRGSAALSILPVRNLHLQKALPMLTEMADDGAGPPVMGIEKIWPPWQFSVTAEAEPRGALEPAHVHLGQVGHREILEAGTEGIDRCAVNDTDPRVSVLIGEGLPDQSGVMDRRWEIRSFVIRKPAPYSIIWCR